MKTTTFTPNRYLMQPSHERFGHIPHFAPRSAREATEIARRRAHPRNSLVLEEQEKGERIILKGLVEAGSVRDVRDWADSVVPAALGTAPYLLNGDVMGRHVPLPILAHENPSQRPASEELFDLAITAQQQAVEWAGYLTIAHVIKMQKSKEIAIGLKAGKAIAYAGFMISCVELGDITADPSNDLSNVEVQKMVRSHCMQAVQNTGTLGIELGAFPSAAQLADPISPLSVEIQKAAPDFACKTYLGSF